MAWTANSFPQKLRAVSGMGYYGTPMTLHGYLAVSATHREGDVLIAAAANTLTRAGSNPAAGTVIGILGAISPRPSSSTQTPRSRVTTATVPDRSKYDDDKSVAFYAWIPGNIFQGHFVTDAATDETADSENDIYVTSSAFLATNDWAFGGPEDAPGNVMGATIGFVNPQATTIVGGALSTNPGPVKDDVGGATGTINPLILVVPKNGLLTAAS